MTDADGDDYVTPRLEAWRRHTDWPLIVIAVGSLPILLLEIERSNLPRSDRLLIDIVNAVVLAAFAVDFIVELTCARNRAAYVRREWASLLIVIAQAVALVPSLAAVGALRALRAARLFRIVAIAMRGIAIGGTARRHGRQLIREHAASLAFGVAGLTWLTSAVAFRLAEDVGVDGRLDSFGDALWWSA